MVCSPSSSAKREKGYRDSRSQKVVGKRLQQVFHAHFRMRGLTWLFTTGFTLKKLPANLNPSDKLAVYAQAALALASLLPVFRSGFCSFRRLRVLPAR